MYVNTRATIWPLSYYAIVVAVANNTLQVMCVRYVMANSWRQYYVCAVRVDLSWNTRRTVSREKIESLFCIGVRLSYSYAISAIHQGDTLSRSTRKKKEKKRKENGRIKRNMSMASYTLRENKIRQSHTPDNTLYEMAIFTKRTYVYLDSWQ